MRPRRRRPIDLLPIALGLLLMGASLPAPTNQLRQDVSRVLAVLQDSTLKSEVMTRQRRTALRTIVGDSFDFEETARRALGRHWTARTAVERGEFVDLFRGLLEETYLTKFELYADEDITYLGEAVNGSEATVRTRIVPKRGAQVPVDYRMHLRGDDDRWRIYDVVMDGVSLVDNYRAQFNRIIQTSSYGELITKIQAVEAGPRPTRPVGSP